MRPKHFAAVVWAVAALALAGTAPVAVGEPASDSWDIGEYDYCLKQTSKNIDNVDPVDIDAVVKENQRYCCYRSGGEWNGSKCVAPAGNSPGAPQVPGGIELAPVVTPAPPAAEPPKPSPPLTRPPKCPPGVIQDGCLPQKAR